MDGRELACDVMARTRPRNSDSPHFPLESELLDTFMTHLGASGSPLTVMSIASEFNYTSGRADLVGIGPDNAVHAFEAKLFKWRIAMHQAYRNTSFADYSFVVLPSNVAERAQAAENEFTRRRIGLISVASSGFEILIPCRTEKVLRPKLRQKAVRFIMESNSDESSTA